MVAGTSGIVFFSTWEAFFRCGGNQGFFPSIEEAERPYPPRRQSFNSDMAAKVSTTYYYYSTAGYDPAFPSEECRPLLCENPLVGQLLLERKKTCDDWLVVYLHENRCPRYYYGGP